MAFTWLTGFTVDGSVGIGADNPGAKLHITKDNTTGNALLITNSGSSRSLEINHNADGTGVSDEVVRIMNNGARLFTIESDGKVGIGTNSPLDLLALHNNATGAVDAQMNFTTAATGQAAADGFRVGWNGTVAQMYLFENADMRIATNNVERMRISSAGAIRFNAYGAGYLKTDASGNITAAGASQVGPFLPLAGGTMTGNTIHNDNVKSIYGTSSDGLEIYHDGTDSIIADTGTGNLYIRGAASMRLQGINQSNFLIASQGGNVNLYYNNANKFNTSNAGVNITGEISLNNKALLSNQENTDVDSAAAEVVAEVAISYTAAFFDFVVKKGTNIRSGTVYACHDGTNVEFTETSTQDLGDTSDVVLSVDISGTQMRLIATVTSDDWSVKSLIRAL